jgi:pantetheine-phosphate adenylyltransferase
VTSKLRVGLYPGTFDPITNGHSDIILRASKLVDRLVIGIAIGDGKSPLFSTQERVAMVSAECEALNGNGHGAIEVKAFNNLLMDFAVDNGASVIIRGLRAVSDFEYEFQMASMNAKLNPQVETLFLMAAGDQHFVSSRLVKEVGRLGGDITRFVSPRVAQLLKKRFAEQQAKAKS